MERSELIRLHPRLFHMSESGSWPAIREFGLRTTFDLVTTSGLSAAEQQQVLTQRRTASVRIAHPEVGVVTIRDQQPLRLPILESKLTDMTVAEWIGTLNDRVFLWLHPSKLQGLLRARRYRDREQDVITVDTASLLGSVGDRVRLSAINSGAALYPNAAARGSGTFQTIEAYDYAGARRRRGAADAIVELAVIGGIPDFGRHVVHVERRRGDQDPGRSAPG